MMKHLFLTILLLHLVFIPQFIFAQGEELFSDEKLNDLILLYSDPDNSAFIARNRGNVKIQGYIGDYLSTKKAKVVKVEYSGITLDYTDRYVDRQGNTHEQPTRTRLYYYNSSNCYGRAIPWLNGGWELAYDPDISKTDWMFFNNKTCKFGLVYHDGNPSTLHNYSVKHNSDGTFSISVTWGNSKQIKLTASADRSKVYNETGAYYTKFTDDFREFNIKSNSSGRTSFKQIR